MRATWKLLVVVHSVRFLACAPASSERSDRHADEAALAVRVGKQCALELVALARPSPESALRALELDPAPRGAARAEARARVGAEVTRRLSALADAARRAGAPGPGGAGIAASVASIVAGHLCEARDATYVLARMPRPARVLPSDAFVARAP